jgi:ATP-dependent exoDNAse (exonuclease V) beta subunit
MSRDFAHVRFISAGAGSGKTYRLTEELERALVTDGVAPSRVIGTTFTVKAAGELRERVRERLIRSGQPELAEQTAQALIGTVHSVCERLLKRFAFELGLSPELHVASLEDCDALFRQALDEALSADEVRSMNEIAARLDIRDADSKPLGWHDDVKKLIDRARDNDVGPDALPQMGRESAAALLAFFPQPEKRDWDGLLLAAVRDALHGIDLALDTTVGTADYYKDLRAAIYRLRRPGCPWSVWMTLSHAKPTKRSEAFAAKVRTAAAAYDKHPLLHSDLKTYIENVYTIAAQALARFQDIKKERGLVDFPDLEQLTLRALDEPAVRARLGSELELLLVDEFQDTNPMQLAIFMKLAAFARKVIFVGDVKQAIYAFRGCDPDLVFATLEALAKGGSDADILEHSWRSRPALVSYINSVFTDAFADEIPAAQVTLEPRRVESTDEAAVLCWRFDGDTDARADALARAISDLVASGYRIVDPQTNEPRPVRWGDIAVLAATNPHVEDIAIALRAMHVPMKMTLPGLFTVPETCLAKACLRRLNDTTDTLATAEIIAMAECVEPEVWLAERLQWLVREDDGYAWAETTHPIIAKLAKLRDEIGTQSPVEVVARVLNYVGIREVVTAWGPNAIKAMQRQRNLDALLNLAVEYERHCEAQHLAATLTGFLFWLEHPHSPELDLQPVVTTGDAVHVLTYHKAKGLEWPVVVNTDFHYAWQSRVWDVRVETNAQFRLDDPLANRAVRFWPRVFGRRSKAPVLEAIVASETGRTCETKRSSEIRRTAYVGLTRARDCIVLALPTKKPGADAWIHAFAGRHLLPQGELLELDESSASSTGAVPESPAVTVARFSPRRMPARAPHAGASRESVNPSAALALENARIGEVVELGGRVKLHGEDMAAIGTALHALIAAELLNPGRELENARALLAAHCGVDFQSRSDTAATFVDAESALAAARRFRAWIEQKFAPQRTWVEYPVAHLLEDGRAVRGWIDVLLETDSGLVVIDHKSSPRPKSEWPTEALEHSGQLAVYAQALAATGKKVVGCWIHFPVSGGAAAIELGRG